MRKITEWFCLVLVGGLFLAVSWMNLFQSDRPTHSDGENRDFVMPEYSWASLSDGEYYTKLARYVSDTFLGRETLISVSSKTKSFMGLPAEVVVIQTPTQQIEEDTIFIPVLTEPVTTVTEPVTETTQVTTEVVTEPVESGVRVILLSENSKTVVEGNTWQFTVTAENMTENDPESILAVSSSDEAIAGVVINGDTVTVSALTAGKATVRVEAENGVHAEAEITVQKKADPNAGGKVDNPYADDVDYLAGSSLLIYHGAVYQQPSFGPKTTDAYAGMISYYSRLFPNAQVNVLVAPLSSAFVEDAEFKAIFKTDQKKLISDIYAKMGENINCVDAYSTLYEHKDEYNYYKSDHHWTALGAYYAYRAFITSRGQTPTELSAFPCRTLNDAYLGSMVNYTKDERVKTFFDRVDAYLPLKLHTMTVYQKNGTLSRVYDNAVNTAATTYASAFIRGDQPYTVINVPENPQDKTIMVIKDSYGNAFVPYLIENYGNIIVVDPRYVEFNIYETLKDYPLTDILFCTNAFNPSVGSFVTNCLRIVGVTNG